MGYNCKEGGPHAANYYCGHGRCLMHDTHGCCGGTVPPSMYFPMAEQRLREERKPCDPYAAHYSCREHNRCLIHDPHECGQHLNHAWAHILAYGHDTACGLASNEDHLAHAATRLMLALGVDAQNAVKEGT
jgi:hypothetical protein